MPDSTLTTQRVVARQGEALAVSVDTGDGVLLADLPTARGGGGSAPAPGSMMRASIAACLLIGYKQWGKKLGVPLEDLELELSTEIDMRGQAGVDGLQAGWQSIRWHVKVRSSASREAVEEVLSYAERLSPLLDSIHPRCSRLRTFELKQS